MTGSISNTDCPAMADRKLVDVVHDAMARVVRKGGSFRTIVLCEEVRSIGFRRSGPDGVSGMA